MTTTTRKSSPPPGDVAAVIAAMPPDLREMATALRALVRSVDASVGEAIKWNAPSFHTAQGVHFATMNLRAKDGPLLILHLGTGKRAMPAGAIDDPAGLLTWLGPDRASVRVRDAAAVASIHDPLRALLRQWLQHV
jgi:hypothetical protein